MSYTPPHLRPANNNLPAESKVVNLVGKVHWPTNLNSGRANNVVQPKELYRPPVYSEMKATTESLGLDKPNVKPILKMVKPIRPNTRPVAIPTMALRRLPPIFRKAVTRHVRRNRGKGSKSRRRRR
jgi:hypothetical protein